MILHINTTEAGNIKLAFREGREVLAEKKVRAIRQEAEKLLLAIKALLKVKKINLKQINKIEVENRGGSFTSLRIGVVTANALAYALGIPVKGQGGTDIRHLRAVGRFNVVEPVYDREPEITMKKSRKP